MDEDKASRFISSLVKSIQALCNGFVDFSTSIEVIGHIHLNIDRNVKLDYVLTEEVSKSASEGSTVFASHSYHSQSPSSVASKNTSDTSNHGQKSRKDNETDPLGLSALPREVPNTSKSDSQSSNRVGDNRNSSHTSSGSVGFSRNSDSETLRHERSSFQVEDSTNKRRKIGPFSQSNPHPAAKRNRPNDFGSDSRTVVKESGFEVIEIKEEPDEDVPAVFFGGSSSGQDIQTPDFSNVVMESLDRVSQLEQNTDLAGEGGDGMGEYKQPVFPVMFHQGDGMSSSAGGRLPGPSSDPQAIASTSGDTISATSFRHRDRLQRSYRDVGGSFPRSSAMSFSMGYRRYSKASLRLGVIRVLQGESVRKVSIELRLPRETLRRHAEKAKRSFHESFEGVASSEFPELTGGSSGGGGTSGQASSHHRLPTSLPQTTVTTLPSHNLGGGGVGVGGVGGSNRNPQQSLGGLSGNGCDTGDGRWNWDDAGTAAGYHVASENATQDLDDVCFISSESGGIQDTDEDIIADSDSVDLFGPVSSQDV